MASSEQQPGDTPLHAKDIFPSSRRDDIDDREFDSAVAERQGAYSRLEHFRKLTEAQSLLQSPRRHINADPAIAESMTDASHAERFAEAHAFELRFDHRRERWLFYDQGAHRWRPDIDGHVYRMSIQFARLRQLESVMITDGKTRTTALQYFIRAESKAALDRNVAIAKCLPPIADDGERWDLPPWLLCCPNGVLDLKSGELRDGDPADRMTMSTSVKYAADAVCPRWDQFLGEVFEGDQDVIGFVQRYIGYAMTGLTHEQVLAFFYGKGANGKGTLMNTISHVLGDYAYNMPFSTVELANRSAISNDVAALEGRRFVTASETNEDKRLNESRIKALTGCDPITARFLHREFFTFKPVAKFILAVNHKPVVKDDSYGFWRRIRLVPFLKSFTGEQRDPGLETWFRTVEAPGILRWCLQGCLDWQRIGLKEPFKVIAATNEYETASDPLNDFLADCVEADPPGHTKAAAIQESYVKWTEKMRVPKGERMSAKVLGMRLADRLVRRHTEHGWVYDGIKLITNTLW